MGSGNMKEQIALKKPILIRVKNVRFFDEISNN